MMVCILHNLPSSYENTIKIMEKENDVENGQLDLSNIRDRERETNLPGEKATKRRKVKEHW